VVEAAVKMLLIGAASIAILTTLGIVLSLVFNTIEFFRLYPASDFFFGTNWAPSFSGRGGSSDLGVLPLLWGTFYISLVALAVAIPIGLMGLWRDFTKGAIPVLTWGGLRGGISVALALSLPAGGEKDAIVTVCYAVVVFSILVQGMTIGRLVTWVVPVQDEASEHE